MQFNLPISRKLPDKIYFSPVTKLTLIFVTIAVCAAVYLLASAANQSTKLIVLNTVPYVLAEKDESALPARTWLTQAIEISKLERLSPPEAARLYAYVASVYADTLEKSLSENEASLATSELLTTIYPKHNKQIIDTLSRLNLNSSTLGSGGKETLKIYLNRFQNDGSKLSWDKRVPSDKFWYERVGQIDSGAASGNWTPWNINLSSVPVSKPPNKGGLDYQLDLTELELLIKNKNVNEEEAIFFWDGKDNFYDPNSKNIPLPGIWQNIFYAETAPGQTNRIFAKNQKILSQAIADATIASWKYKYDYFTARPSMVLSKFNPILTDPPSPEFVSDYAAVGTVATQIISHLFPDKKQFLENLSYSSARSRILGGVDFPSSVKAGDLVGQNIAEQTLVKYFSENINKYSDTTSQPPGLILKLINLTKLISTHLKIAWQNLTWTLENTFSDAPLFSERSKEAGLNEKSEYGALWADIDNDGYLDLMTARGLYRNNGQGKFTKLQEKDGLRAPGAFGDYNNDGCADFYAVKVGHERTIQSKGDPDLLFRGNCDSTFLDVTAKSGMKDSAHGNSAAWADFDNDGLLDLYVANLGSFPDLEISVSNPLYSYESNILYRNNGDGTFTDVTKKAGVEGLLDCPVYRQASNGLALGVKVSFQPVWFDYNNDLKLDLLVISDNFMSPLYQNNGDGTFTQVTEKAGLCGPERDSNMGAAVGDYNNDGWLDVFVNDNGDDYLWQNNKDGTFSNVAKQAGVNEPGYGWGTESFDFDNDGYLDLLVVNGNNRIPAKSYFIPNLKSNDLNELFKNNGNGTFSPVGLKAGLDSNDVNFSAAVADINNDGFPDFFIPTKGERHSSSGSELHINRGNSNNWLTIQLVGTRSNRDGVGARLILNSGGLKQIREIISGSSYVSQSTPWPTFGLGKYQSVDSLDVRWPSGLTQTFLGIKSNQKIIIQEGSDKILQNLPQLPNTRK